MDRPIGNTTDVYAECEKWYFASIHGEIRKMAN